MEKFFTPARRFWHEEIYAWEDTDEPVPFEFTEEELAVSVESFLNQSCGWSDFLNVSPILQCDQLEDCPGSLSAEFTTANGKTECMDLSPYANSSTLTYGQSRIFWHMVMTSNCEKLLLSSLTNGFSPSSNSSGFGLCSAPVLSGFLGGSPWLKELDLQSFVFEEDHCRALTTLERTDLKISFTCCTFDAQDGKDAFIEWLRHSQVVTSLLYCEMESCILSTLHGNSSVKSLKCIQVCGEQCEGHLRSFAKALPGNQGIEVLDFSWLNRNPMSVETWNLMFRCLWMHPRIKTVYLNFNSSIGTARVRTILSAESKADRMHALLQIVLCNTVVQAIDLPDELKDEEFYLNHILPRLEMNRNGFGEQRAALKRADPSIRGQLLGRALHVVRYNPDLFFRFLTENVPAFVRSDEDAPITLSGHKRMRNLDAAPVSM